MIEAYYCMLEASFDDRVNLILFIGPIKHPCNFVLPPHHILRKCLIGPLLCSRQISQSHINNCVEDELVFMFMFNVLLFKCYLDKKFQSHHLYTHMQSLMFKYSSRHGLLFVFLTKCVQGQ